MVRSPRPTDDARCRPGEFETDSIAMKTPLIALLVLVSATIAGAAGIAAGADRAPAGSDLGTIGSFTLNDVEGKPRTAAEWGQSKAVVYCVLGTECPVS